MNEDLPLITVITVTKNRPNLLERAIKTVKNQTYPNVKHFIIIDDCPSTKEMLESKYSNDNRIEWEYYTRKEKFTDNYKDRRKLGSIQFEDISTKRRKISISMKFNTYYIKVIAVNKETNEELSQVIVYP